MIFKLAQNYEAVGQDDQALEHYRRLKDEYPSSNQAAEAGIRAEDLESLAASASTQEKDEPPAP